jgi:prolyl 4-hydroxylase
VTKGQKFGANVWFHSKPLQLAWTKFECCKKQKTFVENGPLLWGEGDLDAMFHRIAKDPELAEAYHTKVLSSPKRNGPWVIALQNFLTPDEAATLVELGAEHGYENSTVGMDANQDDSTQSSMQVFCEGECEENEVVQLVLDRIYELTQIPEEYSEQMQLLKYEMGQL